MTWKYVRWFHKLSEKVLTTTETMVKELHDNEFDHNVIPWTRGVDRTIFNSTQRVLGIDNYSEQPVLLCVSRISREKNLEDFFELKFPNAIKIMVGDGPMRSEYESLYPDVKFVGFKTGEELSWFYSNADVFVFPSRWETFGIVMIESMACGTPVAAYPCSGPLDVVDQGVTGHLDNNLLDAVYRCIYMKRDLVEQGSQRWSWDAAWEIFKENLVTVF